MIYDVKEKIKELLEAPKLVQSTLCHAVRTELTKEKAIERLQEKIDGVLDGRPIKFENNRNYFSYLYKVKNVGYKVILISLPKNVEYNPIDCSGIND